MVQILGSTSELPERDVFVLHVFYEAFVNAVGADDEAGDVVALEPALLFQEAEGAVATLAGFDFVEAARVGVADDEVFEQAVGGDGVGELGDALEGSARLVHVRAKAPERHRDDVGHGLRLP